MKDLTKTFNKSETISFFKLETAVENIPIVSILISSLYRNLKLVSSSENTCNSNAQKLYSTLNSSSSIGKLFTNDELVELFNTSLSIPTSESQIKQKKFWISPLVPEIGNYGLAARNKVGSWNPGAFILEIIANYSSSLDEFICVVKNLYFAMDVDYSDNDSDIWSVILKNEFEAISQNLNIDPVNPDFNEQHFINFYNNKRSQKKILNLSFYAKNTIVDLNHIINLKDKLTRQKWIGVLEAFIRLTMFNHIIYTINLSKNYFELIRDKLKVGANKIDRNDIVRFLNQEYALTKIRLKVGTPRKEYIRDHIENFAYYNALITAVFEHTNYPNFSDFESEYLFIEITENILKKFKDEKKLMEFKLKFQSDNEQNLLKLSENSTFKNITESLGYLCSRKSSSKEKYISDVNFLFDKNGSNLNSPYFFKVSPGLISTLTSLIFLRKKDSSTFISGLEFIRGLNEYNIQLSINDISTGNIKETMLSLGIVIDCPDTEGGVLIIKPGWIN